MKRFLILATILISFVSFSIQTSEVQERPIDIECLQIESYTTLTGFVLDLYYNKISFKSFIDKYLEWSMRANTQQIVKCIPSEMYTKFLSFNVISKIGWSILYASNCEKDLGPSLIILDQVISNLQNVKAEWKQALINSISLGFIGYQTTGDCRAALENIKQIWGN